MLGFIALAGLFAALSFSLSSPSPAYAQQNSAPEFTDGEETTRRVDENTSSFENIGDPVAATGTGRLVYSLENARTSPITIVRATGQLQVGQPLDYETKNSYTVEVIVTDPDGDKDTITVTINVNNVEEDGTVSLTWTRPQVGTEITASLTDPDGSISGTTWQWAKSSNRSSWGDISGETSASYTPVANDVDKYLQVTASYTDSESSGTTRTAQAVSARKVQADPGNDNDAPVFRDVPTGPGGYSCSNNNEGDVCRYISRSTPAGSDIYYPVRATDPDGDEIRYSLSETTSGSGDTALFRIDPLRGTLFTTGTITPDNDRVYNITIKATDPSEESGTLKVKLTPSGGKGSPVVNGPKRITYTENGTWSLARYSATTADADAEGGSRPIRGWIIGVQPGGGDGDFFDIDDDGVLTFTQPPDYEDPADENRDNVYDFHLHVYDTNPPNGERPAQTFFNVSVTVTDVSGEVLEIRGPSVVDYAENRTDAVAPYTFTLQGVTAPAEWSLSGADGGEFDISATGELTFKRSPDYEAPTDAAGENAYLVTITAYKGTESKTEFVRVRVTDVNEPPGFDDDLETTLSVDSSTGPNQQIGDPFTATDPDKDAVLTYTLSTDTLPFSIDEYNGQLSTVPTLTQFDRSSYTVTVLVADGKDDNGNIDDSADDKITVTINIAGGGNNEPVFPPTESGARSIAENTLTVENVGAPVIATDDDTDDTLTYTLGGTDAGYFTIVDTSGQIKTKAAQSYDFESKRTYSVTVTVSDGNSGTATKDVTITLTNVEEDGTVTLSPAQPTARVAITASLNDLDGVVTGTTTWQWTKSDAQNGIYTDISGEMSATYVPQDGDVDKFLKAKASYTDGHGPNKTAEMAATSAVQTGTNRPPDFVDISTTREVAENTVAGQPVGDPVTANDPDNDALTYSLTGADMSLFDIDTGTGQVKVKTGTTLDYEGTRKKLHGNCGGER